MSAGHRHHGHVGLSTMMLNRLYDDKQVNEKYHRPYKISQEYDLPYLGGYSMDGETIYFDRHLPEEIEFEQDGRKYKFSPEHTIPYHERFEKAIMDALGWTYAAAHQAANANERRHVVSMGLPWPEYQNSLKPYIKADEHEKLKKLPPDLDMRPYLEAPVDHKLVDRMEAAMEGSGGRHDKKEVDYSEGKPYAHCGPVAKWKSGSCKHFLTPHSCEKVRGYIVADMWCKLFSAKDA